MKFENLKRQVLFVVLTCEKYDSRINTYRDTIGEFVDCIFTSDHEDVHRNIIKTTEKKDYLSAEEKQINITNMLITLRSNCGKYLLDTYNWFFFCDCDTFVDLLTFEKSMPSLDERFVYGLIVNKTISIGNPIFTDPHFPNNFEYLSGGGGFLVHSNIIRKLVPFKNYQTGSADVSMSLNFHHNQIQIKQYELSVQHLNCVDAIKATGSPILEINSAMQHLNQKYILIYFNDLAK